MSRAGDERHVVVGAIAGAHGVRGDVRVKSFTSEPKACFAYGPLLDADGRIIVEANSVRAAKNHFIVAPKVPREKEEWDAMKGVLLHVPRTAFPQTTEDEFYITDLVGLDVYTGGDKAVGTVKAVQNFGAGDIVEISLNEHDGSVLVPFTRIDVPRVDLETGRIVVTTLEMWQVDNGGTPKS